MYPQVVIPGFEPSQITDDLTQIIASLSSSIDKLNEIFGGIEGLQTTLDAIFADMVGEVTFLASIAELNAAIAALAEDIDVAIAALGAAMAAAIAGQTAALIANLNANFNGIQFKIDATNALLTTISGRLASIQSDVLTISGQIATLNTDVNAGFSAVGTKLTQVITELDSIGAAVDQTNTQLLLVNSRLASIFSAIDFYFPRYRTLLQDCADNTNSTAVSLIDTNNRLNTIIGQNSTLLTYTTATNIHLANISDSLIGISNSINRLCDSLCEESPAPRTYTLLYNLWQALAYGGYFTAGVGTGRLNVST